MAALRHQLGVYQRRGQRPSIVPADRLLWSVLSRFAKLTLNERHLERLLSHYFAYYREWRLHRTLDMDAPDVRAVRPTHRTGSWSFRRPGDFIITICRVLHDFCGPTAPNDGGSRAVPSTPKSRLPANG